MILVMSISTHSLFDLSEFPYKEIFVDDVAWSGLLRLDDFMHRFEFGSFTPPKGVYVEGRVSVGPGTVIEPGVYIKGPCVIGSNCVVRHGAYLRGNVLVGNHCVLGHCSEFKNAILLNGAKAPHFNYVGDSIIGSGANLSAGVICANYRLDGGPIAVKVNGARIDTGMTKLGALVGDEAMIGCNAVLNPGSLIAKGARVGAVSSEKGAL